MTMTLAACAALILTVAVSSAEARTRHQTEPTYDRHAISGGYYYGPQAKLASPKTDRIKKKREQRGKVKTASRRVHLARGEVKLLPHPVGCPSRAFCGCGAALDVFGKHVRELWLARNWFKFQRTAAAPGMVAVRRHHVFVIRKVISPGVVLAYDANSGGHKTRLHIRRLAGYVVVNPRGSKYASL